MLVQCSNAQCGTKFPRPDSDAGKLVTCPQCNKSTAAVPVKDDRLTGRSLGDYKLIRAIAKGGMGQVFEADQTRLGRSVALKVLNANLADDPMFIQRFEREARAAAAINHPNIVHVYDFGQADGHAFLVMEFIDGEDLAKIIAQAGKMPLSDGLRIVGDVASALQEAYSRGIIHRDIKPANILLTKKGVVKVSDLGLARRLDDDVELTATGAGIGTPHFMSPEQARDAHSVDHRADIYSLGITLLYLLTGKRPFDGKSSYSIVLAHSTEPLPSGLELGTELPANVETLIKHMAAKSPVDRYSNYSDLIADIRRVRRGEAPLGPGERHTEPMAVDSTMFNLPPQASGKQPEVKKAFPVWKWAAGAGLVVAIVLLSAILVLALQLGSKPALTTDSGTKTESVKATAAPSAGSQKKELSPDDMRALQDIMADGKAWREGLPSPLPPIRPMAEHPLRDAPPPVMISEADAYATANPTNYRSIISRYQQIANTFNSMPAGMKARTAVDDWTKKRNAAADKLIAEIDAKVRQTIAAGKHQEGVELWRDFPMELRAKETDDKVDKLLDTYPPPDDDGMRGAKGKRPPLGPKE